MVQFIIEGYGDMATVTTVDSRKAVIRISIVPDFISDMDHLIDHLKNKYNLREIENYLETGQQGLQGKSSCSC